MENDDAKHAPVEGRSVTEKGSPSGAPSQADERSVDRAGPDAPRNAASEPDRPPVLALLESLDLYRNAKIGIAAGLTVAIVAYLVRFLELLGPLVDGQSYPFVGPETWFLLLAFVLAVTMGLLVTVGLLLWSARRAVRDLD